MGTKRPEAGSMLRCFDAARPIADSRTARSPSVETESFRTGPPSTPVVQRSTFNSPSLSVPHRLLPADRGRPWPPTHARPAPHVTRIDFLIGNTTMHHGRTMGGGGGGESGTGTDTKARARHTLVSLLPLPLGYSTTTTTSSNGSHGVAVPIERPHPHLHRHLHLRSTTHRDAQISPRRRARRCGR